MFLEGLVGRPDGKRNEVTLRGKSIGVGFNLLISVPTIRRIGSGQAFLRTKTHGGSLKIFIKDEGRGGDSGEKEEKSRKYRGDKRGPWGGGSRISFPVCGKRYQGPRVVFSLQK